MVRRGCVLIKHEQSRAVLPGFLSSVFMPSCSYHRHKPYHRQKDQLRYICKMTLVAGSGMHQLQNASRTGSRGHFAMSSISSFGGGGGFSRSSSTTTKVVNGRAVTVTEEVTTHPDGRISSLPGDEMIFSHSSYLRTSLGHMGFRLSLSFRHYKENGYTY